MTQNHVNYNGYGSAEQFVEGTLDYARANSVPIVNADQWLAFTETRHDANYSNITWDGTTLSFRLNAATISGVNLTTILPLSFGGNHLPSVLVDGVSTGVSTQTINGVDVAFVSVAAGNHNLSAVYSINTRFFLPLVAR